VTRGNIADRELPAHSKEARSDAAGFSHILPTRERKQKGRAH